MDPKSPAQWREAAAMAEACLMLESARMYGLVEGGPGVNSDRCVELLGRAKQRGIVPTKAEVDQAIAALVRGEGG